MPMSFPDFESLRQRAEQRIAAKAQVGWKVDSNDDDDDEPPHDYDGEIDF